MTVARRNSHFKKKYVTCSLFSYCSLTEKIKQVHTELQINNSRTTNYLQSDDVIVDGFKIFTFMSAQLLKVGLVAKLDMA